MGLTRSEQMSRIKGADTKPELLLRGVLLQAGLEFTPHVRVEGIRADLVCEAQRIAVFIDGCFWHGCPAHYVRPRSRTEFWAAKLRSNVERDRAQVVTLERAGWRVVRVWEHEVFENADAVVSRLSAAMAGLSSTQDDRRVIRVEALDDERQERRTVVLLRNLDAVLEESVGPRITAKWRRPARGRATPSPLASGGQDEAGGARAGREKPPSQ